MRLIILAWKGIHTFRPGAGENRGGIDIKLAMHQPNHWPYLGFVEKMKSSDIFVIFDKAQFVEKDFHHRNRIRDNSPAGFKWLTVPVVKKRAPIADIMIEDPGHMKNSWKNLHRHAIDVHYRNAIHYPAHKSWLDGLYDKEWVRLIDLNMAIIEYLAYAFDIKAQVRMSSDLECIQEEKGLDEPYDRTAADFKESRTDADFHMKNVRATQRIIDVCKESGADTYISGIGGRNYLIEDMFVTQGIKLEYLSFHHPAYKQRYPGFIPDLSSLDYIMNVDVKIDSPGY